MLWGVTALCGVAATAAGVVPRRVAYLGGAALFVVSLAGHVDVYALGATESVLGLEWQPPGAAHDPGGASDGGHDHSWGHGSPDGSFADRPASATSRSRQSSLNSQRWGCSWSSSGGADPLTRRERP